MRDIFLTGVLVAILATCNMLQEPEAEKAVGEGKVLVSIQVDQGYSGAERSVFPQVTLNDLVYTLWGAPVESGETELLPSFTTQDNPSPSVALTEGLWNFTVKGYKAEDLVLQGELKNQTISLTSHSLNFSVEPLLESTGSISISITLPANSGVTTVLVFKDGKDGVELKLPEPSLTGDQVSYSEANVAAGDYYYTFRLNNDVGNTIGVVSQIVQVRAHLSSEKTIVLTETHLNTPPVAPSAAPLVASGNGQLGISWEPVEMASDYEVYWSDDASTPLDASSQPVSNMTTTVINELTNGTTYYVWVTAQNAAGSSGFSPMASGTPLVPPANIQAVPQSAESILISWDEAAGGVSYTVYRSNTSEGDYTPVETSSTPSYTNSGLSSSTTYYYKVSTVKGSDESDLSAAVSATTQIGTSIAIEVSQNDLDLSDQSAVIPQGQSPAFHVIEGYAEYQWYLNGNAISGATGALYTLNTTSMKLGVYELSIVVNTGAGVKLSGYCHISVEKVE